jgi:ribosome-associated translation inhibitor RaiA
MAIQVAGTNVDSGGAFTSYASGKISAAADKYTGSDISGHRPEKGRALLRTSRAVRLKSGLMLEGTGEDGDTCASADAAIEHLEKRHRRHKRRIKNQHGGHTTTHRETFVSGFTVKAGEDEAPAAGAGGAIAVIDAESERGLKEMQAREAVMQLDLIEKCGPRRAQCGVSEGRWPWRQDRSGPGRRFGSPAGGVSIASVTGGIARGCAGLCKWTTRTLTRDGN